MNDDAFLCAPLRKSDFFSKAPDGITIGPHYYIDYFQVIPPKQYPLDQKPPSLFHLAQLNTFKMMQGENGARVIIGLSHAPNPMMRKFVDSIEMELPKTLHTNRTLKFRSMDMICFTNTLVPNIAFHRRMVHRLIMSPTDNAMEQIGQGIVQLTKGATIMSTDNLVRKKKISLYWECSDLIKILDGLKTKEAIERYAKSQIEAENEAKFFTVNNSPDTLVAAQIERMRTFLRTMIYTRSNKTWAASPVPRSVPSAT